MELKHSLPRSQQPATHPWPHPHGSNPSPSISVHFNVTFILCLRLSSGLFPSDSSYKTPYINTYMYVLNHTCHMTCPPHPRWFDHPNNNREEPKTWSSLLWNYLHSPFISSLLCPNIFPITLVSNTLNVCSPLNVRDQASYPYKTTGTRHNSSSTETQHNISKALRMLYKKVQWLKMCTQIKG
jgi:hypothetical protein